MSTRKQSLRWMESRLRRLRCIRKDWLSAQQKRRIAQIEKAIVRAGAGEGGK